MLKKATYRLVGVIVILALILTVTPPTTTQAATLVSETFRNASATNWQLLGSAQLTSGGLDPAALGWLRLTSATDSQAGSAIYNTPFSSADGVQITFSYATYGGTGADGFTFYLIDGSTTTPTVGASGGSLGYSSGNDFSTPGVTNGYVGIGFDEYGSYSESHYGSCNPSCPGSSPNYVVVRGSGNLAVSPGFNFLTQASVPIETTGRSDARQVRITITPSPNIKISVEMDSGSGFVTLINGYNLSSAPGQGAIPATFKMGFSASTGGSTNIHEIRDLVVNTARPVITLTSDVNPSMVGDVVLLTARVTAQGIQPTGTVAFYDGLRFMGDRELNADGYVYMAVRDFELGNHQITARYLGDIFFGSIETDMLQIVAKLPDTGFTPGKVTLLPKQEASQLYKHYQDMWIEIPKLKIDQDILGIPVTDEGWDVSWLGSSVGWLEGTAFPTSNGNSALSAHVWNADNTPGTFYGLDKLAKGDKVIIHNGSASYIYQVQSVSRYTQAFNTNTIKIMDEAWLTLITCHGYNENMDEYLYRIVVKAKLIEVK